jgi:hypothetical protein
MLSHTFCFNPFVSSPCKITASGIQKKCVEETRLRSRHLRHRIPTLRYAIHLAAPPQVTSWYAPPTLEATRPPRHPYLCIDAILVKVWGFGNWRQIPPPLLGQEASNSWVQVKHVSLVCFLSDRCSGVTVLGTTPFKAFLGQEASSCEDLTCRRKPHRWTWMNPWRSRGEGLLHPQPRFLLQNDHIPLLSVLQHPKLHHTQRSHLLFLFIVTQIELTRHQVQVLVLALGWLFCSIFFCCFEALCIGFNTILMN